MRASNTSAAQVAQVSDRHIRAQLAEIARRYAWHARQKRQHSRAHPGQLITRVRLRELERLFARRWGEYLPDDDAGRDDLVVIAHHIAHIGGDVVSHIVAWAGIWCPWMATADAAEIAAEVAAKPKRWKADTLGWRLRLTDAERTALKITTIGSIDVNTAARAERRKVKRRAADRARRAKLSSGKPRGRPKLNPRPAESMSIAGLAIKAVGATGTAPMQRPVTTPRSGPARLRRAGFIGFFLAPSRRSALKTAAPGKGSEAFAAPWFPPAFEIDFSSASERPSAMLAR